MLDATATEAVMDLMEASAAMVILSLRSGALSSSGAREWMMEENMTSAIDP